MKFILCHIKRFSFSLRKKVGDCFGGVKIRNKFGWHSHCENEKVHSKKPEFAIQEEKNIFFWINKI